MHRRRPVASGIETARHLSPVVSRRTVMIVGDDSLPRYTNRTSPARRALPSGTSGCCRDGCPVLNIFRSCWFGLGLPASTRCKYRRRAWFVTAIALSDGSETVGDVLFLRVDCWLDIVLGRPDVTAIARSRSRTNFAGTRPLNRTATVLLSSSSRFNRRCLVVKTFGAEYSS